MGIKDFHKWIKQDYGNCVKSYWLSEYNHCYIDLNYALHFISFTLSDKDDVYENIKLLMYNEKNVVINKNKK